MDRPRHRIHSGILSKAASCRSASWAIGRGRFDFPFAPCPVGFAAFVTKDELSRRLVLETWGQTGRFLIFCHVARKIPGGRRLGNPTLAQKAAQGWGTRLRLSVAKSTRIMHGATIQVWPSKVSQRKNTSCRHILC